MLSMNLGNHRTAFYYLLAVVTMARTASPCGCYYGGVHLGPLRAVAGNKDALHVQIENIIPHLYYEEWPPQFPSKVATIDLLTGRVTPGPPLNATLVETPVGTRNSTEIEEGYNLAISNEGVLYFIGPDGCDVVSFGVPYPSPSFSFFVSKKLNRAYIFVEERRCFSSGHDVTVAIIELTTSNVSFFTTFVSEISDSFPLGFDCYVTSLHVDTLYDDVGVVTLPGYDGICLRNTYVFFNETAIHFITQTSICDSWDLLDAVSYNEDSQDNSAFLVEHEYDEWEWGVEGSCFNDSMFICPKNYSLHEIILSTGEILRTIKLNGEDILSMFSGNESGVDETTSTANDTGSVKFSHLRRHDSGV